MKGSLTSKVSINDGQESMNGKYDMTLIMNTLPYCMEYGVQPTGSSSVDLCNE